MIEQRNAQRAGCQSCSVRQRRNLVAEVGTRYYGSGYPSVGKALCPAYAHQRYAYRGNGGPRRARHYAHEGADDATRHEKYVGMDDVHAIIY